MGRPSKLDPKTAEAILIALAVGTPIGSACKAAGIGTTTFKTWMNRGRSEAPEDAPYRAFRSSVKKAQASAQVHALSMIQKAMRFHWQAAAWYLERTDPKRWGRKPVPVAEPNPERPLVINIDTQGTVDPARRNPPPRRMLADPAVRGALDEIACHSEPLAIESTQANGRP